MARGRFEGVRPLDRPRPELSTGAVRFGGGERVRAALDGLALVDHHVHGAASADLDRAAFEDGLNESAWPAPPGTTWFDSQLGFAVRRWCAPVLDLPPHTDPDTYLARRAELGAAEVNRRLLGASGVGWFLVETGYRAAETLSPRQMATASGAHAAEVVRLEAVAESVADQGVDAAGFADRFAAALDERARAAIALKSVIAYRFGLDFDPEPPAATEVKQAAGRWLAERGRGPAPVRDPVLLRHLLWAGVEHRLPLQFHIGFGDPDLTLHRTDPSLMTGFLRRVRDRRVPVLLLHCYPYHRTAGYLAHAYPHVHLDVGLAVNHTGVRSTALVAETLEVAPFGKVLYSSDGFGPAELHHLGAVLWRRAMAEVLGGWVDAGDWSAADMVRVAELMGAGNARRVYRLEEPRDG